MTIGTRGINPHGYIIKVTESALIDMCLGGLEAYTVRHKERQRYPLETYGLIWGNEATLPDDRTLYTVHKVSIDTSADKRADRCIPKEDALFLKNDFMTSFFPDLEFLGDFHTHPYLELANDIRKERLYQFSKEDISFIEDNTDFLIPFNYRIGLVMTIAYITHTTQNEGELARWMTGSNSAVEMKFSNYRLWLQAYCVYRQEGGLKVSKKNVSLQIPGVLGLNEVYTPFGKFDRTSKTHNSSS